MNKKLSTVLKSNNSLKKSISNSLKTGNVCSTSNAKIKTSGLNIPINLKDGGDIIKLLDDTYLKGGYHVVKTIEDRDAIDCCHRKQGMMAVVVGEDYSYKEYRLITDNCEENIWVEINSQPDIRTVTENQVNLTEDYSSIEDGISTQLELNIAFKKLLKKIESNISNLDIPTNTSELLNDGEDGINPFLTEEAVENKADVDASNIDPHIETWRTKIDANYIHDQASPKDIWVIDHPLNKKVSTTVIDTAGTIIEGKVSINSGNRVVIEFNFPFSGEAILN